MKLSDLMTHLLRLSTLERFNTRPRVSRESVAEHSFFVAIISMILSDYIIEYDDSILFCKENVITMALLHDLPELEYSDIPHDVKNKIPELKDLLQKHETNFFKSEYNRQSYMFLTENKIIEAQIVHLADILAVRYYAEREISLGNSYFHSIKNENESRLYEFIESVKDEDLAKAFKSIIYDFVYDWRSLI